VTSPLAIAAALRYLPALQFLRGNQMSDVKAYEAPGPVETGLGRAISPIEEIIDAASHGKMFILVDHEDRENEGDLVIPAEFATPEAINFMATHGRGLICLPMTAERIDRLGLPMMVVNNSSRHETAFTVSIEAREGVSTGISAADRAHTIATAINDQNTLAHLATPGHVFPLRARRGGVLVRAGHTAAAIDISRLAGLHPSGVICEIMNDDGSMARLPDLVTFAARHDMRIGTISDLIAYRHKHDNLVREVRREAVTSAHGGDWEMRIFADQISATEHVVLVKGDFTDGQPVLARTHALDALEDVLGIGLGGGHGGGRPLGKLPRAMEIIAAEGRGAVFLFRQPRPTLASEIEDEDTPRTIKHTGLGAQIMSTMGLHELILLTDNPDTRYLGLDAYGISIVGTRPLSEG